MQSLKFDDGLKSFAINDDESRVIRFNPSDPDIIRRYHQAVQMMEGAAGSIGNDIQLNADGSLMSETEDAVALLNGINGIIRDGLKMMFNYDVYDAVFAGQSPFAGTSGGKLLFERFMESLLPVIEEEMKAYQKASEERTDKYLKGYKK